MTIPTITTTTYHEDTGYSRPAGLVERHASDHGPLVQVIERPNASLGYRVYCDGGVCDPRGSGWVASAATLRTARNIAVEHTLTCHVSPF
ncbi:hypothetical protein [Candidatus Poriferisocius sp.]|uniref:hypothetical protein n=1 Tax=Candidatus Poriferisocius sp. TaxID=3101276 RepID=UPI003B51A789